MPFTTRCSRYRGFTALELIIVLVIGFSIIAVSASKMGELFLSSKITRATSSILELAASIRSLRGPEGYGNDGSIIEQMKNNGLIPRTLREQADQIKNEWDGTVGVEVDQAGSEVILTYPNIPKKACAKLANAILESGVFIKLAIDGGNPLTQSSNTRHMLTACTPANNTQDLEFTLTMGNS